MQGLGLLDPVSCYSACEMLCLAGCRQAASLVAQAGNAADPLRYAFIVSQAELVATADEAAAASFSKTADLEGVGPVCVGVLRAEGEKCSRSACSRRPALDLHDIVCMHACFPASCHQTSAACMHACT